MKVLENKTTYVVNELIGIAKRENNKKRNYLLVNSLQAKHVPVGPKKALKLFEQLGCIVYEKYKGKNITFIGFAETATAIGAAIACGYTGNASYIHTTREKMQKEFKIVDFQEEHSHAIQQKLYCDDSIHMLKNTDVIVFVEDEVTTGKTILNFVDALEKTALKNMPCEFAVASIVNSMQKENMEQFYKRRIEAFYLLKMENDFDDVLFEEQTQCEDLKKADGDTILFYEMKGKLEPRKGVNAKTYKKACTQLAKNSIELLKHNDLEQKQVLVLGTEEFMYPAIITGEAIMNTFQGCHVNVHSTTRSPIVPSEEERYPLYNRCMMESFYEKGRKTYLYNLEQYDAVILLTDAHELNIKGVKEFAGIMKSCKNKNIIGIKWVE